MVESKQVFLRFLDVFSMFEATKFEKTRLSERDYRQMS